MKISHIAANKALLDSITYPYSGDTALLNYLLFNQSIDLSGPAFTEADIVHIHGMSALSEDLLAKLIDTRLAAKKTVIISLVSEDINNFLKSEDIFKSKINLIQECHAVFVNDASLMNVLPSLPNWIWAPLPINCIERLEDEESYETKEQFKVLYFANNNDPFEKTLVDTITTLNSEGFKYESNIVNKIEEKSESEIAELINNCEIYIENPNMPAVSINSLKALSLGKTVLANLPENLSKLSNSLEFIPILKTNIINLHYRLSSIAKQPKCLRDFGKRGIQYMKTHHNPKEVIQGYIEIYSQYL